MRWDSPLVLATAGTLALHVLAVTAGDALVVTRPPRQSIVAPRVELVEVEVPPVLEPPPPPVAKPPEPVEPTKPAPQPRAVRPAPQQIRTPEPPPPDPAPAPPSGGDEVVHMDDIAPAATGVAVATGKRSTGHVGRGGTGGGTGAGSGAGIGDEVKPMSVATIKTPALPKGDAGYLNLGKDYPAEALALRIEGPIRVRLVIDKHGKVTSRVLLNRLGHGLDEIALNRAAEIEFEPAKDTDDNPVASVIVWTFTMTLPK